MNINLEKVRHVWQTELGLSIACFNNLCSVNIRHSLLQFKVVHRLYYYSGVKMNLFFFPQIHLLYVINIKSQRFLLHIIYCIFIYKATLPLVFNLLISFPKLLERNWKPISLVAILRATEDTQSNCWTHRWALMLVSVTAKKLILQKLKSDCVPTFEM